MSHADDKKGPIRGPDGLTASEREIVKRRESRAEEAPTNSLKVEIKCRAIIDISNLKSYLVATVLESTGEGYRFDKGDTTPLELGLMAAEIWGYNDTREPWHVAITREAARLTAGDDSGDAGISALAAALADTLAAYWRAVSNPPANPPAGISWPDHTLGELLRQTGEEGARLAGILDTAARARFEAKPFAMFFDWDVPGLARYPMTIAVALWADKVKPAIEAERARLERIRDHVPAVAYPIAVTLGKILGPRGNTIHANDAQGNLELWTPERERIAGAALLPDQLFRELFSAGTGYFESITAIRLIVYLLRTTSRRYFADEKQPGRHIFNGGKSGVRKKLGITSKRADEKILGILEAGVQWKFNWGSGTSHGLWTFDHRKASPGNKAQIVINAGEPLLPNYVNSGGYAGSDRVMVPVVEVTPEFARGWSTHGAQAGFQQALVRAIIDRRDQVFERGGAHLPKVELWKIARQFNLTEYTMDNAIDVWKSGVFLDEVDRDHYQLADNDLYGGDRKFITKAGEIWKVSSDGGKASKRGKARRKKKGNK